METIDIKEGQSDKYMKRPATIDMVWEYATQMYRNAVRTYDGKEALSIEEINGKLYQNPLFQALTSRQQQQLMDFGAVCRSAGNRKLGAPPVPVEIEQWPDFQKWDAYKKTFESKPSKHFNLDKGYFLYLRSEAERLDNISEGTFSGYRTKEEMLKTMKALNDNADFTREGEYILCSSWDGFDVNKELCRYDDNKSNIPFYQIRVDKNGENPYLLIQIPDTPPQKKALTNDSLPYYCAFISNFWTISAIDYLPSPNKLSNQDYFSEVKGSYLSFMIGVLKSIPPFMLNPNNKENGLKYLMDYLSVAFTTQKELSMWEASGLVEKYIPGSDKQQIREEYRQEVLPDLNDFFDMLHSDERLLFIFADLISDIIYRNFKEKIPAESIKEMFSISSSLQQTTGETPRLGDQLGLLFDPNKIRQNTDKIL